MTQAEAEAIILGFPGTETGTSWGQPSYKAYGKFFTRYRPDDGSLVLGGVGADEREMLMEAEPETFHSTPHHDSFDYVLARIATLDSGSLVGFLERRWRKLAPKAAVRAYDAAKVQAPG